MGQYNINCGDDRLFFDGSACQSDMGAEQWPGPDGFWIYLFYGFCSAYFFPDALMVVFKTGKSELEG